MLQKVTKRDGRARKVDKLRVFVVDPSPIVRNLLVEFLWATGLCETVASSGAGAAAVRAVRRMQIDLVVMDMSSPSVCAISSTRTIRALAKAPKVILLCQHEKPSHKRRAATSGADGYVSKLDCADTLPALIRQLCPHLSHAHQGRQKRH